MELQRRPGVKIAGDAAVEIIPADVISTIGDQTAHHSGRNGHDLSGLHDGETTAAAEADQEWDRPSRKRMEARHKP
jgi:hypothetical protein